MKLRKIRERVTGRLIDRHKEIIAVVLKKELYLILNNLFSNGFIKNKDIADKSTVAFVAGKLAEEFTEKIEETINTTITVERLRNMHL